MSKLILLQNWAARHFDPPPAIRSLRAWVRKGYIHPTPVLVGREYRVKEDAVYHRPPRQIRLQPITVLNSEDPIVNEIINNGQTQKRRQA